MARENFGFKKRQREQARERKKQEKAARKAERAAGAAQVEPEATAQPATENPGAPEGQS